MYTVSFDSEGGSSVEPIKTNGKEKLTMPSSPTKEGYSFIGWYRDKGTWLNLFTAGSLLETPITQDITVYARWVLKTVTYTVKFNTRGGDEKADLTSALVITTLPQAQKTGYDLLGWSLSEDNDTLIKYPFQLTSNITLYAVWEAVDYEISFSTNGGYLNPSVITANYMEELSLPVPTREGYAFLGWFRNNQLYDEDIFEFTENIFLEAKWEAKSYTVVFDYGYEGAGETSMPATFGETAVFEKPLRTGYLFEGWYYNGINGRRIPSGQPWSIDSSSGTVRLTAKWIELDGDADGFFYELNSTGDALTVYQYSGSETVITVPDSYFGVPVTAIGNNAFQNLNVTKIILPDSVKTIGAYAFAGSKITEIRLPTSLITLGYWAFKDCKDLASVNLNGVSVISEYAFQGCTALTSIEIPASVTRLSTGCFASSGLKKITFLGNSSLQYIYGMAFLDCEYLTSIVIPATVTVIEGQAFEGCKRLTVYCKGLTVPETWNSEWNLSGVSSDGGSAKKEYRPAYMNVNTVYEENGLQFLISGSTAYVTRYTGTQKDVVIPSEILGGYVVNSIARFAFSYSEIDSLSLPSRNLSIHADAFYGAASFTTTYRT